MTLYTFAEGEILRIVELLDPDCPDKDAYLDGHCDIFELVERAVNKSTKMTLENIIAVLKRYHCQYTKDDEGNGVCIVDVLSPREDPTIKRGLLELELLAEHILYELLAEED